MRGRKNLEIPSTNNILPPCRVCGEPGTGFHYGVTTCGACKGFFRRSLTREDPYVCIQSQLCKVGPSTSRRQSCPKCRYDKCIAVGMSKEACKVGRYSLLKRAKDKEEAREQTQYSPNLPHAFVDDETSEYQHDNSKTATGIPSTPETFVESMMEKDYDNIFNDLMTGECVEPRFSGDKNVFYFQEHHTSHSKGITDNLTNYSSYCDNLGKFEENQNVNRYDDNYFAVDQCMSSDTTDECANNMYKETNDNNYCITDTITQTDGVNCNTFNNILNSITSCQEVSSSNNPNKDQTYNLTSPSPIVFKDYDNTDLGSSCTPQFDSMHLMSVSPEDNSVQIPNSITSTSTYNLTWEQPLPQYQHFENHKQRFFNNSMYIRESNASDIDCDVSSNELSSSICSGNDECTPYNNPHSNGTMSSEYLTKSTANQNNSNPYAYSYFGNTTAWIDGIKIGEQARTSSPGSNISKRLFRENDEESEATIKKKRLSENMDRDFGRKSRQCKSANLAPRENDKPLKPIVLCIVAPDPLKYTLSIFEQFPFKSFETKCLAPLLKLCYNAEEYEFGGQSTTQKSTTQSTGNHPQQPSASPTFHLNSILTSENSLELPTFARESTYDAVEMDNLFDYLQEIHCHCYGPESSLLSAPERERFMEMYHKICQLKETLQGKLNLIDDDKYFNILETTGIDVDKRKEWFSCTFGHFDEAFTRDTQFFRALPGFTDVSLKDRINLIKSTALIHRGLIHHQSIDIENDVVIDPDIGVAARVTSYFRILPGLQHIYDSWICILQELKQLAPSFNESIVLRALSAFITDFCEELDEPELITQWYNKYLNCLKHVIRKHHGPNADDRFNKTVEIIQMVKETNGKMKKTRISVKYTIQRLSSEDEQPLLKEVFVNLPRNYPTTAGDH